MAAAPGTPTAKGARTRDRILATATDLFHQRGINATSLGEVLRASSVGKGQFYQHFDGKADLVEQVLNLHAEVLSDAGTPIESWSDLRRWMTDYVARQRDSGYLRGCPIGTAAYALWPDQDAPRARIEAILAEMRAPIVSFLAAEQRSGRLTQDSSPEALADFVVASVQGAMILGLVARDPGPVSHVVDEAYRHLTRQIVPGPRGRASR